MMITFGIQRVNQCSYIPHRLIVLFAHTDWLVWNSLLFNSEKRLKQNHASTVSFQTMFWYIERNILIFFVSVWYRLQQLFTSQSVSLKVVNIDLAAQ